jgi:hypothetical protein
MNIHSVIIYVNVYQICKLKTLYGNSAVCVTTLDKNINATISKILLSYSSYKEISQLK